MKTLKKIAIACALLVSIIGISAFICQEPDKKNTATGVAEGKSFAVLELFTSEGCNSCPPAEQLLEKLGKESAGKPIYVLNYHVDYFDHLGWKDAFGSRENTRRQQEYSTWLNSQVYTPQLVVNGTAEFIGSDEKAVRSAIASQLSIKHQGILSVSVHKTGKQIKVDYLSGNTGDQDDLILGLIQKNGSSNVLRGENAGLRFSHIQIVRNLQSVSLKQSSSGSREFYIPLENNMEKWEVIGIIQNRKTGRITAVDTAQVNQ
ncbi:DUF1223 domain-containing protein [Pedobacter miscanthi]|uniref:DUF1223 domain-containing protein n=1 Tax=Pedobacter miscanthi TaxID=2259170 RepID=A0A366LEQ2_9SPHI|nr:DUF1223 domain-containing protein [Pedobacter miscanthi]RBQ11754.1 DUF1223 domain-containing protein [Pedobacter miscanthi]